MCSFHCVPEVAPVPVPRILSCRCPEFLWSASSAPLDRTYPAPERPSDLQKDVKRRWAILDLNQLRLPFSDRGTHDDAAAPRVKVHEAAQIGQSLECFLQVRLRRCSRLTGGTA